MENTYTLDGNILRVDNRFVDFSTYEGVNVRHQELPAFYTIGALGKFSFYNGNNPWTGAALTEKRDLAFWGGNSDAYFKIRNGNSETWCAWTDDDAANGDFGIGLYVPNVQILLAGRYRYGETANPKSSMDDATNYVAPLCTMGIKSFKPLEYSYLITAGKLEDIRTTFTENRSSIDNSGLSAY